ncbi:conserved Plasmodium protein, unknown function [Plasmodium ovale curtisi]|uniref:Uncharacterized protein n=1 Tax=Plasmodium ovale curtisi TaxID=864141 RepID=A0A1A8VJJ7_PLAOA|nr:conserved Plasmodium protein, unknown function [Plasmodium ovale curtisi]
MITKEWRNKEINSINSSEDILYVFQQTDDNIGQNENDMIDMDNMSENLFSHVRIEKKEEGKGGEQSVWKSGLHSEEASANSEMKSDNEVHDGNVLTRNDEDKGSFFLNIMKSKFSNPLSSLGVFGKSGKSRQDDQKEKEDVSMAEETQGEAESEEEVENEQDETETETETETDELRDPCFEINPDINPVLRKENFSYKHYLLSLMLQRHADEEEIDYKNDLTDVIDVSSANLFFTNNEIGNRTPPPIFQIATQFEGQDNRTSAGHLQECCSIASYLSLLLCICSSQEYE